MSTNFPGALDSSGISVELINLTIRYATLVS